MQWMEIVVGKSIRRISNWKEYNQALVNRGSWPSGSEAEISRHLKDQAATS
jgi:hypothetical protein